MKKFQAATYKLAQACDGSPVSSTIVVILFFFMFNTIEATIEILIFGNRFEHLLDPIFGAAFIGYAAYAVYYCAIFNNTKRNPNHG